MEVQRDFRELLESFNANAVEYVVVGGHALAFHGAPRHTGGLDVYVDPTEANARRVLGALADFGFGDVGLDASDFQKTGNVVQLGVPPVRVDIVTSIDGVEWAAADVGKAVGRYGELPVPFIGRKEFIANKRATGRQKDLADLEAIGEH